MKSKKICPWLEIAHSRMTRVVREEADRIAREEADDE